jgi:amidase
MTIDRRVFLSLAAAASSAAGLGSVTGCAPAPGLPAVTPRPAAAGPHADLEEATVAELAQRMARGELTARDLTARYLARIEALDRAGPALRSVLEVNPDADAIAAKLDEERRTKGPRGPLHGIPVLLKDNLDTGDRMQTTAGSLALVGSPAPRDAAVVARLREAGAVILGKTNLSEWANMRSTRSTSGWSGRGGLTRNPYCLDRNTSGSSSGSAAAIAASLAAVAVGTETDGSIVSPSSVCGLVGLKPTVGLVSRTGIIPIAHSQDTAGPMTRTVADAALLLSIMAGPDARDPATASFPGPRDYLKALDRDGARGVRIGVVRRPGWPASVLAVFDAAVADLRRLGAVIKDPVDLPHVKDLGDPEDVVLTTELGPDMAAYLATRTGQPLRTLADLAAFNKAHAREEMPWFEQELFEKALQTGGLADPAYTTARATCLRLSRAEGIDAALTGSEVDVLMAPTGGLAWISDLLNGDNFTGSSSTAPAVAGYPSLTVPCGALHGLPLGVLFFAGAYAEPTLLRVAYAYEQATKHRRAPRYLATIGEDR